MGGAGFDRQVFVKPKASSPAPPPRSSAGTIVVLLLVAGLGAVAGYRYFRAGGKAAPTPSTAAAAGMNENTQLAEIAHRLDTIESRLEKVEQKRRASAEASAAASIRDGHPNAKTETAQPPARTIHRISAEAEQKPRTASGPQGASAANNSEKPNKDLNALRGDLVASRQEWQATVNRLGDVVGEVGTQQSAIDENRSTVSQLLQSSMRSGNTFTLTKGAGFQHVGPISMKLVSADVGSQRYSLRLIVNDKSVELKDRALNEIIQFFTSQSQYPLHLVISQINKGSVSGSLAVPKDLNNKQLNPQLQER